MRIWAKLSTCTCVFMLLLMGLCVFLPFNASAGTVVGGYINSDETWGLKGSPYWVDGDVIIRNGANLTVEIGVEVLFDGNYSIYVEEGGVLWMGAGTKEPQYALFSYNSTPKSAGDWGAIQFNSSSYDTSSIINSVIEYATYGIRIVSASPSI